MLNQGFYTRSQTSKNWKLTEIADSGQCRSLRLPDTLRASKVVKLIYTNSAVVVLALISNALHKLWKWLYTNSAVVVLALISNALHKLWKWLGSDPIPSGKMWQPASGIVMNNDIGHTNPPQMWQPASAIVMNNDIGDTNPEEAAACIAY